MRAAKWQRNLIIQSMATMRSLPITRAARYEHSRRCQCIYIHTYMYVCIYICMLVFCSRVYMYMHHIWTLSACAVISTLHTYTRTLSLSLTVQYDIPSFLLCFFLSFSLTPYLLSTFVLCLFCFIHQAVDFWPDAVAVTDKKLVLVLKSTLNLQTGAIAFWFSQHYPNGVSLFEAREQHLPPLMFVSMEVGQSWHVAPVIHREPSGHVIDWNRLDGS